MFKLVTAIICLSLTATALAKTNANATITMNITAESGTGTPAGSVTISETKYGLLFTPNLQGLTPGIHGFHLHENPACSNNGMDAGGHFDPRHTGKHLGPYNDQGHLGDLPTIYVSEDGTSTTPVLAPRLHNIKALKHHALMVHHAGDNYSDTPEKLGGGGARMACGVI